MILNKNLSAWKVFLIFISISFLFVFLRFSIEKEFVTEDLIRSSLNENFGDKFIAKEIASRNRPIKGYYFTTGIYVFLKLCLLTTVIFSGFLVAGKKEITFSSILKMLILCEFLFVLEAGLKYIFFAFLEPDLNLKILSHLEPLSLIVFYDIESLDYWQTVFLKNINFSYFLYAFLVSFSISKYCHISFEVVSRIVILSLSIFLLFYLGISLLIALNYG